jgi:RHS repeat-associated protein
VRTLKYDAAGNLVGAGDEQGSEFAFTYNDRGSPLSMTDGAGQTSHFTYDAYGNVTSKTDPLGRTTNYTYDQMGRALTMTDARGTTRFTYDPMGRVLTVTDPLDQVTAYEYDANGNRTAEVDARGRRTASEYDAANRVSKVTRPDGTTVRYTYNFRGQKLTETTGGEGGSLRAALAAPDEPERTTRYVYDNAGLPVKVIFPDGAEANFTFDEIGRLKTATDERGKTYTYEYDPTCGCADRLVKTTDPAGKTFSYTYDDAGRRASFVDANGRVTRYEYDARDNVVKVTHADGSFVAYTYDGAGRRLTVTDEEGRVTRHAYDEAGNLLSVTDAKGQTSQYAYDPQDNLLSTTDALGRTTRYEYDALNRLARRVMPLGMSALYTYDEVGNLATYTDARGKQTAYEYDGMNRLVTKRPDPSLGEPAVNYTYTGTGRRRSMADASGTTDYTYDLRDRLLTKQTPQGTLTYGYDPAGGLVSVRSSNADGVSVDYAYDDVSRLEKVTDNRLGTASNVYTYDAVGNVASESRANGVRADYTYDTRYRLTNATVARAGSIQASYAYTRDRTGRRLSATEADGRTVNYTYDTTYRLTREAVAGGPTPAANGAVDYTYDAVGNRLSRVSTLAGVLSATSNYDANDRLTSDAYDANGNTRGADGRSFAYDYEDRVKSADGGAVRFVYDGDGNLAAKTAGGVTTRYLVDDNNPTGYAQVLEEVVGGQVVAQYTYGHGIVSQRRLAGGAWAASFYATDGTGSVRQLTDPAGNVTDTYAYDAFGRLVAQTGATPNPYLYRGERFDADLGLYHLRARSYDPNRGRFTTVDPFPGFTDDPVSLHRYLYANADPVNFIDPTGLSSANEYGILTRIVMATRMALKVLARAIQCVFFYVASWIAAYGGYQAWAAVRRAAASRKLAFCVCKPTRGTSGYQRPTVRDNKQKGDDFRDIIIEILEAGGYPATPEVPFNTPHGPRRMDIDLGNGGIETKVGGSPYTPSQRLKDDWLRRRPNHPYPVKVLRFPQFGCRKR